MYRRSWHRSSSCQMTRDFPLPLCCMRCVPWAAYTRPQYRLHSSLTSLSTHHVRLCLHPNVVAGFSFLLLTIFFKTDELNNGRWRKSHYRPDVFGEANLPEGFSEQQARFAKQHVDVGLVRGDFACLQGSPVSDFPLCTRGSIHFTAQMILTWWYLSQGR